MASAFRRAASDALDLPGPEWVLAGNGSDEILTILVRAFVGDGERLRLPYPSYVLYRTLADIQGATWEQVEFDRDWKLPAAFGQSTQGTKLVLLPNPNSPSGTIVAPSEVSQFAESLDCPLVVDEAYADFAEENCLRLVQENPRIMVTRTLSKSYGLAGVRFGFLVANPDVIRELAKIKDSYNCDGLSIAAATAAMACGDWLEENCSRIRATRVRMETQLAELGFEVTPSHANFVWCRHPGNAHAEMYEFLKNYQILVRYMEFDGWGDGLRISVGTDEQVDTCLMLLKRFLDSQSS